jgi:hypothetical protein
MLLLSGPLVGVCISLLGMFAVRQADLQYTTDWDQIHQEHLSSTPVTVMSVIELKGSQGSYYHVALTIDFRHKETFRNTTDVGIFVGETFEAYPLGGRQYLIPYFDRLTPLWVKSMVFSADRVD